MADNDSADRKTTETDIKRTLNPMNGALFALVGQRDFDSLKLQTLKGLDYLSNNIRADNDVSNAIPNGTVLAYKTKHGRYGKLLIENYGYDFKSQMAHIRTVTARIGCVLRRPHFAWRSLLTFRYKRRPSSKCRPTSKPPTRLGWRYQPVY